MSSLNEFINESKGKELIADTRLILVQEISQTLIPFSTSIEKRRQFAEGVSNLVESKDFLSEFSNEIGEPLEHESEAEFVKRGVDTLRKLLYKKFDIVD